MKFTKKYKIVIFIFMMIIYISKSAHAYGESDLNYKEIRPKNMKKTIDSGSIEVDSSETNRYELNVKMNSKGLKKGFYTGYLYDNEHMDLSNYDAMSFYVENESESPLRININITKDNGKVFSPSDDSKILIKKEGENIFEIISPYYGTIELPKSFKGTIYLPFKSLKEKDTGAIEEISKISSWGIVATLAENEEKEFKLSEFSLINKGSSMETYFNSNFSIEGENTIQIPVVGEGISDYKILGDGNLNTKFKLTKPIEGVTISEDGRLTVTTDADAQKIGISTELNGCVEETKKIQLLKSWTLSAYEVDGTSKSIPKTEEVKKLLGTSEKMISSSNFLINTRIIVLLVVIAFAALYLLWNRRKVRN